MSDQIPGERQSDAPTTFYGACPECGTGYWADVQGGPHSPDTSNVMCHPTIGIVCQAHHPVADVELGNSNMFGHEDREAWERWRVAQSSAGETP